MDWDARHVIDEGDHVWTEVMCWDVRTCFFHGDCLGLFDRAETVVALRSLREYMRSAANLRVRLEEGDQLCDCVFGR